MKFEEKLNELENIVTLMEDGKISIDESLDLFAKGVKLCQDCTKLLEEAKGKVTLLEKQMDSFKEVIYKEDENE